MNISIICVGRLKEKYWQDAAAEYIKRLSRFGRIEVIELGESKSDDSREESSEILKKLPSGNDCYIIALDVGGKRKTSEELAQSFSDLSLSGKSRLCFIIGGSNGFDDRVREAADMRLSFSDFTFPHQLMRIILLEQIYRAFKINAGEKYHK